MMDLVMSFTYKEKDGREGFGILVKELRERIEKRI